MQKAKTDIPGDTPLDKLDAAIFQWQNWINVRRLGITENMWGDRQGHIEGMAQCEENIVDAVIAWRRSEHRDE